MDTKNRYLNAFCFACLVVISIIGFMAYSALASGPVKKDIQYALNFTLRGDSNALPIKRVLHQPIGSVNIRRAWWGWDPDGVLAIGSVRVRGAWTWNPEGVFNYEYDQETHHEVFMRALGIPFGKHAELLGWGVRYPFLIPLGVHLGSVWLLPMILRPWRAKAVAYRSFSSFSQRAFRAGIYAFVIVIFFQSVRMFWGSWAWDRFFWSSLLISGVGSLTFYLFLALSIAMYLYCVIGTAGLQVRRKPNAKKQTCIRCGYRTQGLERCPECDLEVGAFIPSKWRVNHWVLAAMFVVAFFSPVMVESVYSVFG